MAGKTKDREFRQPKVAAYLQGLTDKEAAKRSLVVREADGGFAGYWREGGRVRCREVGAAEAAFDGSLPRMRAKLRGGRVPDLDALVPDRDERKARMEKVKARLNDGRVDLVIADLKPHRRRDEAVEACVRYFESNKDRMRYDVYRKRGYPCKFIINKVHEYLLVLRKWEI